MIRKEWREQERINPAVATVSTPGKHVEGESIELAYLDPPFKSNQNCNVLSVEKIAPKSGMLS